MKKGLKANVGQNEGRDEGAKLTWFPLFLTS